MNLHWAIKRRAAEEGVSRMWPHVLHAQQTRGGVEALPSGLLFFVRLLREPQRSMLRVLLIVRAQNTIEIRQDDCHAEVGRFRVDAVGALGTAKIIGSSDDHIFLCCGPG